ncbi:MAG: threonine ammonia-lyase [Candidatus Gastranaerophilales bacterium]|nr:threonine ammonia-lyase [Candidatus Gastranaerophilales bacterium]
MLNLETLYDASKVLGEVARKTDLILSKTLLEGTDIYLKSENLQLTGSFKLRGAYYKISKLTEEQKKKGIIACSAGNHAQGVALAAQKNGIKATIFIPATAPISKVEATRKYGADIKLIDGVYDDAYKAACEFQKETGGEFIHPFNDEDVIAGQGTIGLELLEQLPDVEAVIVPIGGGGLIAGVAYAIKQLKPDCKVYGVQAQGAGSMYKSFIDKQITELPTVNTFADGTAVKRPGDLTFDCCMKYVDDIVTVTDDEVASAILILMERQKLVAEGAGALSVAAAMFGKLPIQDKKTACIVSGGNIDVNILSRVINRGLLTTGRLCHLTIELLDKPGQLRDVSSIIAQYGANVIRVRHNQGGSNTDINDCFLKISLETRNTEHFEQILKALTEKGYKIASSVQ